MADHAVPVVQGGAWSEENGQGMCGPCHDQKRAREGQLYPRFEDWLAGRGLVQAQGERRAELWVQFLKVIGVPLRLLP
ncbi:MAG TPA: HNH endonuclease signature motif containing protein [Thermoanaerobaculia bacterium]|nr:HNH endonuclease signature motif containing protein [Thermoanaerobaculia bacterium]